jgi:hypothetical protein
METHTITAFAQEKPNLYLSANDNNKDWRMTEILVAITESIIQGDDVFTVSSTSMKDVIGCPEQVDVIQIKNIDPKKYSNFIEVRDRGSNVSRNYVQEIMGKRKSTNIQECKIVSTFGFAQPAKKLAAHENIDLRLFELDTTALDQYWFKADFTELHLKQTKMDKCFLHVKTDNKYEILISESPEVQEKLVVIFNDNKSPEVAIPIMDIFNREIENWKEADKFLFGQIPSDGQFHSIDKPIELVNIPSRIHARLGQAIPIMFLFTALNLLFLPKLIFTGQSL